ncbi:helix-turn-helix domain-containing protein [Stieleria varia]|uniref:Helix-turn-helix domain protein n=1 Tax=Stieleria varia TaxID=2528005 RepID=A0A5C6AGW0_9BACT|nr:helix-turn-helix domain-containing protein [Stieleria varia]TWT98538.1 Helix-turn-helix domain protein [Stieleria varia]
MTTRDAGKSITVTYVEAAAIIGVSRPTVSKLVRDGFLKRRFVGNSTRPRLLRSEVKEYANNLPTKPFLG